MSVAVRPWSRASIAVASALAVAFFPAPADRARAGGLCDVPTGEDFLSPAEHRLADLINGVREEHGLHHLSISAALMRASTWKSFDSSAQYGPRFSHTDSLGRDSSQRAADCGYGHAAGENIADGFESAEAVFAAWMDSAGHRENILSPHYLALGVAHGPDGAWTAMFGLGDDPSEATGASTPAPARFELAAGVNLVAYDGPEAPVSTATAAIAGVLVGVYLWDPAASGWLRYFPALPAYVSTLGTLVPGMHLLVITSGAVGWSP